jgi:hypothetical protein
MRYFFVCGAPKSGTTWLQRLLDAHPAVVCSGEGHFIERLAAPMFQVGKQYNAHLQLVAERVYEGHPYYNALEEHDLAPLVRSFIITLMARRHKPGAVVIGDKTPRYTEFLNQLRTLFPDSCFLHMVRDPRDVAVSLLHHGLRAGYADALTRGSRVQAEITANAAQAWLKAQVLFGRFAEANPEQCLELRYEDLSVSPDDVLARTFRFLGVSDAPDIVDAAKESASFEKWAGRKPGDEDKTSFFRKGLVGDWKGSLDQADLDRIAETCSSWMERKGYNGEG